MADIKPDVTANNVTADLKGLSCPMPVLKTKKALDGLKPGQVLLVEVTDAGSKSDIPAMLKRTGNELIELKESGGVFTFLIKKPT
ncbi:MAG: sulfurtransferase TusA family protein [Nitrospirae bacterium]|nr:sulfurtransferase TusA family protein [Nitrospirota bacterium]